MTLEDDGMKLKDMRIKWKMLIGFFVVIGCTILLGVVGYDAISSLANEQIPILKENQKLSQEVLRLRKYENEFLLYELKSEEFFETGSSELLIEMQALYDEMNNTIDHMMNEKIIQEHETAVSDLKNIKALLEDYITHFNQVVAIYTEKGFKDYGRVGSLRQAVHAIEEELSTLDNNEALLIQMLLARRAEKDYFLRNDLKYLERLNGIVVEFNRLVGETDYSLSEKNKLTSLMLSYEETFTSVVETDTELGRSSDEGMIALYHQDIAVLEPAIMRLIANVDEMIDDNVNSVVVFMLVLISVIVVVSLVVASFISKSITSPLHVMLEGANKIADGHLNVEIPVHNNDELGQLSKAFNKMTCSISNVLLDINMTSEQVASSSRQVSDSSLVLAEGATEQASSVSSLSNAIIDITSKSKENLKFATEANQESEETRATMLDSHERMAALLEAMENIDEASRGISKIIKVIDEIAFQTNILALNASVEAARAGVHGKGFAVVAQEVRSLAERSAQAAKETTDLINHAMVKVQDGSELTKSTSDAMTQIVDRVNEITDLIGRIAVGINDQNIEIEQINEGIQQISDVVHSTSATSEQTAAASKELQTQSYKLKEKINHFELKECED